MTNFEFSLLMGFLPILIYLIPAMIYRFIPGQRVKTTVLEREGELVRVEGTHSLIRFDDGVKSWYRNSLFEIE